MDDEKLFPLPISEVAEKIISLVPNQEFDNIYTHGSNGEYGHLRHKETHEAVKELVKNKFLRCKNLYSFSYKLSEITTPNLPYLKIPLPEEKSDQYIELSEENLKRKVSLVRDMYGFSSESFEVLSCNKSEAFNIIK